jgi:hypothetical protein
MGFVIGNNGDIQIVLTTKGKRALLENGLSDLIKYFSVHDDEVIYTLEQFPKVIAINGNDKSKTLANKTTFKQSLQ